MLDLGIIEQSESSCASPIVLVPKPDGSMRHCTEYRKVNALTIPDQFILPRVEHLTDQVGKSKFLTRGYCQVPLDDSSHPMSVFVTLTDFFQ